MIFVCLFVYCLVSVLNLFDFKLWESRGLMADDFLQRRFVLAFAGGFPQHGVILASFDGL